LGSDRILAQPCPMCGEGSVLKIVDHPPVGMFATMQHSIKCMDCGFQGDKAARSWQALNLWNRAVSLMEGSKELDKQVDNMNSIHAFRFQVGQTFTCSNYVSMSPSALDNCVVIYDMKSGGEDLKCMVVRTGQSFPSDMHLIATVIINHQVPAFHLVGRQINIGSEECNGQEMIDGN